MSAPTRPLVLRRTRAWAVALRGRPDLMPVFLLGTPPSVAACVGLVGVIGQWALLAAAVLLLGLGSAAIWSLGGDRP